MRVLHILDHGLPLHSGYTFRTRAILTAQMARGWQVAAVTGAASGIGLACARTFLEAGARVEVSMRGWYAASSTVVVTDELRAVLAEWAARPRRRVTVAELV